MEHRFEIVTHEPSTGAELLRWTLFHIYPNTPAEKKG